MGIEVSNSKSATERGTGFRVARVNNVCSMVVRNGSVGGVFRKCVDCENTIGLEE
jgi:hypothetical protein